MTNNFKEQMLRKVSEGILSEEAYNALFAPSVDVILEDDLSNVQISIIIPTHNRFAMLCRCVDSVLFQTHKHIELLVVDDNSNDETSISFPTKYSNEPRIQYFRNETSLGPGGARQKGYLNSHGEFIVFIDDDDYYIEPRFFAIALSVFAEHPDCALVCGNTISEWNTPGKPHGYTYSPLNFSGWKSGEDYFIGFIRRFRKPSSSFPVVFQRAALDKASFSEMKMMNDASIYLRALCYGNVYALNSIVGVYYIHSTNISKALPLDFIIENLEEKKNIYGIAKERRIPNLDKWFRKQIFSTVIYFFSQSFITDREKKSIYDWCVQNGFHFQFAIRRKLLMNRMIILVKRTIVKLNLK